MHIVIITTSFPGKVSGKEAAGAFIKDFADALASHVELTVIAPSTTHETIERLGKFRLCSFQVPRLPLSQLSLYNPLHWYYIAVTLISGHIAVKSVIKNSKVVHVLAMWALPSGYWARKICKREGIPYSIWALGSDIWGLRKVPIVRSILASVLRDSAHCFADGVRLKGDVEKISGRPCEFLVSVRRLPVKKKKLSSIPPYKLAFLGRWHKNKGIDLLIESLKILGNEDWAKIKEVRICGGGPMEKIVISGCDSLRKAGRPVKAGGYLGKEEAAGLLEWADYLLLTSRIESIPVVFSDAMQARCPVIATPVGDLPRLLNDDNVGILADEAEPLAIAAAIRSALYASPNQFRDGLEQAGGKFDLEKTVNSFLNLISPDISSGTH